MPLLLDIDAPLRANPPSLPPLIPSYSIGAWISWRRRYHNRRCLHSPSSRFRSALFGSGRLRSALFDSCRLYSALFGTGRLRSAVLGLVRYLQLPFTPTDSLAPVGFLRLCSALIGSSGFGRLRFGRLSQAPLGSGRLSSAAVQPTFLNRRWNANDLIIMDDCVGIHTHNL